MTGHVREERLALYAWGDLASGESRAVTAHIECCGECRRVLDEFRRMQSFLAESLQDPELDDLIQVREAVTAKIESRQAGGRGWRWGLAGAAVALGVGMLAVNVTHRRTVTREPEHAMARPPTREQAKPAPVPATMPKPGLVARARRRRREAGLQGVTLMTGADGAATLKMTTDDPNVVILWQLRERTADE